MRYSPLEIFRKARASVRHSLYRNPKRHFHIAFCKRYSFFHIVSEKSWAGKWPMPSTWGYFRRTVLIIFQASDGFDGQNPWIHIFPFPSEKANDLREAKLYACWNW